MHTDPNFLELKTHLNGIERSVEAGRATSGEGPGIARRVLPLTVLATSVFAGVVVSLGGLF